MLQTSTLGFLTALMPWENLLISSADPGRDLRPHLWALYSSSCSAFRSSRSAARIMSELTSDFRHTAGRNEAAGYLTRCYACQGCAAARWAHPRLLLGTADKILCPDVTPERLRWLTNTGWAGWERFSQHRCSFMQPLSCIRVHQPANNTIQSLFYSTCFHFLYNQNCKVMCRYYTNTHTYVHIYRIHWWNVYTECTVMWMWITM